MPRPPLSRPCSFPHLRGRKFQFWDNDDAVHSTVLFEPDYGKRIIHVLGVGVVRYRRPGDDENDAGEGAGV